MKKNYILILMLFACNVLCAQVKKHVTPPMIQARIYLNKSNIAYDPPKAVEIYKKCAAEGNARAMNILAILYSEGTGTEKNQQEALTWFERSAQNGYDEAFFNLGNLYRTGWGVEQNFKTAYQWYQKGVAANSSACMYEQGYMLYKGLGVKQDYQQAIRLFRQGIKGGSLGSTYMLALCYRNGYGIAQNTDSARYLLNLASAKGYRFAKEELAEAAPEALNPGSSKKTNRLASTSALREPVYAPFKKIAHTAKAADIAGEYSGFIIRYDWSGEHVIGKTPLTLSIKSGESMLAGIWAEDKLQAVPFTALFTDTALVFANSSFQATDHYSAGRPVQFLFKNVSLQLVKQKDSVYMAGNVQLWSATLNEPEKPVYISLVRNTPVKQDIAAAIVHKTNMAISGLVVYPNPVESNLQLSFSLEQQSNVLISITDMQGKTVHTEKAQLLEAGKQVLSLQPKLISGAYVVSLRTGGQVQSTVIIKP